jgi:L-asparaginase II
MIQAENPALSASSAPPVLVEVTRGPMVEARHRGVIAVVDADGELIASLGDIHSRTWYRSAAKPFQTVSVLASGAADRYDLSQRELAVITGSHNGEEIHLELVRSILGKIGLDESCLLCGAHPPYDEATWKRMRAAGEAPAVLHNNCSGKHAGMLGLARHLGEPIENYIDPNHVIQRQNRMVVALFADVPVDDVAVAIDGCSAPVFGLSVESMARSFARLIAVAETDIDPSLAAVAARVVDAMTAHPEMIGGSSKRLDTDLMRAARGRIISKVGAEGVQLLGVKPCERYPNGLGIAIKIEDGDSRRARDPVVIETLRQLGLLGEAQLAQLSAYARADVFNHRKLLVGEVRTSFKLEGV